jgi:hypothetical protein
MPPKLRSFLSFIANVATAASAIAAIIALFMASTTSQIATNANTVAAAANSLAAEANKTAQEANEIAKEANSIVSKTNLLNEPTISATGYWIASVVWQADGTIILNPIQEDKLTGPYGDQLIPPTVRNAGTTTAKNVIVRWIPTYVAARGENLERVLWSEGSNSNSPMDIGPGERLPLPCLPGSFISKDAKLIDYVYGVLEVSYEDALHRHKKEHFAFEINSPSDQPRLYMLITEPKGICLPEPNKLPARHFANVAARPNPSLIESLEEKVAK